MIHIPLRAAVFAALAVAAAAAAAQTTVKDA